MSLFSAIQSITGNPALDNFMVVSAEYLVLLVPVSLVYLWFFRRDGNGRSDSFFSFFTVLLGLVVSYVMGMLYSHGTPYMQGFETILTEAAENSFPSQHTTVIFSLVWPLAYRKRKKLAGVVGTAAMLTGFARTYTGLHFPLDILGGVGTSLIGFFLSFLMEDYIEKISDTIKTIEEGILSKL